MRNRDRDENVSGSRGDMGDKSIPTTTGSSKDRGSSIGRDRERMRDREDSGSDMAESGDELQRKQSEGDLGNEQVRGGSRSHRDMRGVGEE